MDSKVGLAKEWLDKFLVLNFFLVVAGALLFLISVIFSLNGVDIFYRVFQLLWFPLFIPVISIFFTAVLIEIVFTAINKRKE
ncbi:MULTISPECIES: hypothetical protein [Prochlorococcus]|uniref:hypothetical protein n=1 Tax=Prochlorococcus TaxID=1218 RepID=UPI000533A6C1|nr:MULTISPECIES: hypothetical protein [Prochlorococcus]KGG12798.1 putative membrane protein [Prochlorococcus sp. MIT 0601]